MPTNSAIPVTILAVVLVLAILWNRSRSKATPSNGAPMTTAITKASHVGSPAFCTRMTKMKADANACAPKPKLNTPVV